MTPSGALRGFKAQLIKPIKIKMQPGSNLREGRTAELPASSSQLGVALPPRGHLAMPKDICDCQSWKGQILLASSRLKQGILLNTLLVQGQPSTTKDCPS